MPFNQSPPPPFGPGKFLEKILSVTIIIIIVIFNFHDDFTIYNGTMKQPTCIRPSGGEATVDVEHPIGMWPGENTPFLYLRLQRRVGVPGGKSGEGREKERRRQE